MTESTDQQDGQGAGGRVRVTTEEIRDVGERCYFGLRPGGGRQSVADAVAWAQRGTLHPAGR